MSKEEAWVIYSKNIDNEVSIESVFSGKNAKKLVDRFFNLRKKQAEESGVIIEFYETKGWIRIDIGEQYNAEFIEARPQSNRTAWVSKLNVSPWS